MAGPVRARRLSDEEGRKLQQIVRRGKHGSIRVRRAVIIMASASGTSVPADRDRERAAVDSAPAMDAADGCFAVPPAPGFGVRLNHEEAARHPRTHAHFNLVAEGWERRAGGAGA